MAALKLPRTMESLPREMLSKIFSHLRVSDLLSCRRVNRLFNDIVGLHADKILYNVDVGLRPEGTDTTALATLARTEFPFENFRIHIEKLGFDGSIPVVKIIKIFSRASTLIVCGNLAAGPREAERLVKAALKSLKSLSFGGHCFYTFKQTFLVTPKERPISLPKLEELRIDEVDMPAAGLEDVLRAAPGLRRLSIVKELGEVGHRLTSPRSSDRIFVPLTAGAVIDMVTKWCPNLESLDLSGIRRLSGMETLCDSEQLRTKLKKIVLGSAHSAHPSLVQKILRTFAGLEGFSVADMDLGEVFSHAVVSKSITEFRVKNERLVFILVIMRANGHGNPSWMSTASVDLGIISRSFSRYLTTFEAEGVLMSEEAWKKVIHQLGSQCASSLEFLSLSANCEVTNSVVRLVMSNLTQLRTLKLGKCSLVTDDAFIGLDRPDSGDVEWPLERDLLSKQHPDLTALRHLVRLNLEFTKITDLTLEFGLKHKSLEFLNIEGCRVSRRGLSKVTENAPNLRQLRVTKSDQIDLDVVRDFVHQAKKLRRIEFPGTGNWLQYPRTEDETWCFKHLPLA